MLGEYVCLIAPDGEIRKRRLNELSSAAGGARGRIGCEPGVMVATLLPTLIDTFVSALGI